MALSPMMQNYIATKQKYQDCILFYRLGDFYEMFYEDAEVVSAALGLTLTGRDCGLETRAPMCGIPYHASANYIKKLLDHGFRVAICEQVSAANKGSKTIMERAVVKVVTPGTVSDDSFLTETQNNFVAAVSLGDKAGSVSWCDITTGQFYATEIQSEDLTQYLDAINMVAAKEIICNEAFDDAYKVFVKGENLTAVKPNAHYDYAFAKATAYEAILKYFKIVDTQIFDFKKDSPITSSAGALIEYLGFTQKQHLANIQSISVVRSDEYMIIDKTARENLELTHQYREPSNKRGSLLWVLDETKTPMGARLLVNLINRPLQNIDRINQRLNAVSELVADTISAKNLAQILSKISDISRLAGKIASRNIMPRDMLALAKSLGELGRLKNALGVFGTGLLKKTSEEIMLLPEIEQLVGAAIVETPPAVLADGGYIKIGYNAKLDEYRSAGNLGREWIAKLEQKERVECKIKNLKIGYNRISGYYFEVPRAQSNDVPYRFTRRATTAATERFITQELKELEDKILGAEERAIELEQKLFAEIRDTLFTHIQALLKNADAVAIVDVLRSFAAVAVSKKWVRPKLNNSGEIRLEGARHPVIEQVIGANRFIANDCLLSGKDKTMIITGPNMAGKSTYMRTVALCVLLAHIGSFVPCASADIALTDRIFTRIGASDSMLTGQSTFMVEMNEVSNIIHNATEHSLLLLDEIGRGTGTNDGLALAQAIILYITDKIGAPTMFATHFHQLTELANSHPQIHNYKVLVEEINGQIVFLHRVVPGAEQNSFGIDVARLSGMPDAIIAEAKRLIAAKRTKHEQIEQVEMQTINNSADSSSASDELIAQLRNTDINSMSPLEALNMLAELKKSSSA